MAPIPAKRAKDFNAQKFRKRQRIEPRARAKSTLSSVPLEALSWKETALSDRLDDAEGFFGLEEIDDVEVVRDASSGKIEFRVGEVLREAQNCEGVLNLTQTVPHKSLKNVERIGQSPPGNRDIEGSEEEWSGFEGSDGNGQEDITISRTAKQPLIQATERKKKKENKGKQKKQVAANVKEDEEDEELATGTFEALNDKVDEEADGKHIASKWPPNNAMAE